MNDSGGDALPPIVKADPKHKRLVIWLLLGILVVGVVLHLTLQPYVDNWIQTYEEGLTNKSREELMSDYQFFTTLLAIIIVIPIALLGTVFLYQGYRVYRSGQYPYPRMMILRDTPLETGLQAMRRGRRFFMVGGFVLLSGCFLGWYLHATLMQLVP